MKKLIENFQNRKYFVHILALVGLMAVFLFAAMFFMMRGTLSQNYERSRHNSNAMLLSTADELVNCSLLDLGRSMQQQMWAEEMTGAVMRPSSVSYREKSQIVKSLDNFETTNPMIRTAYLISYAGDTVYDGNGNISTLKESSIAVQMPLYSPDAASTTISDGDFSTQVITGTNFVGILQSFPMAEKNGAMYLEIEPEALFGFLGDLRENLSGRMEVSFGGHMLYSIGNDVQTTIGPQNSDSLVGKTGWTFSIRENPSSVSLSFWETARLFGVWLILLGAFAVLLSLAVTTTIYRPIQSLSRHVQLGETVSPPAGNELEMVQKIFDRNKLRQAELSDELAQVMPLVRERLYKNLIRGHAYPDIAERLQQVNSSFSPEGNFQVFFCTADPEKETDAYVLMYGLLQGLQKALPLRGDVAVEAILTYENILILIAEYSAADSAQLYRKIGQDVEKIVLEHAAALDAQAEIFVGRGRVYHDIKNLSLSAEEAATDLRYSQYQADAEQPELRLQDAAQSDVVITPAVNGDTAEAMRQLERMLAEPDASCAVFETLFSDMIEKLTALHAGEDKMEMFSAFFAQNGRDSNAVPEALIRETGEKGILALSHYGQKNRNRYVRQTQEYILEHFFDSSLSLDTVAEAVGINAAYLSRLFGEEGGDSFVNFVNRTRVEKAKILLHQTNFTIREIGFKTGFNSMQNFNRVFKRWTGVSPSVFRKQKAQKNQA